MNTEMMPVPFKGATLYLAEDHQEPYVPMRPVVEGMGLDWKSQYAKITTEGGRWKSTVVMITTVAEDGRNREMICMPLKKLPGWLMSIDPNKVKSEIRHTVIDYQNECDDVLWEYWSNRGIGKAFKPESGFSPAAFNGHEEGSLNPFFREFKTMQRFNIALGYSRQASARKANEFVHTVYGLDMCELNNTPANTICSDDHLELETQRINAGKQSHEIDAFWATYYKLTGQLSCCLNHSNDPSFIALNIKQFKEACIANGLPIARVLSSKKQLQFSKKPAFMESNKVINSTITKKAIRCWIFALN